MWTTECDPRLLEAEQLLENVRVPYKAIDVDKMFPGEQHNVIKEALFEYTQSKQLPSVFVGNDYIGTLTDLERELKSGDLKKSLKAY